MMNPDVLLIGEIVGVHGIKGAVRVRSYAESPSIFNPGNLFLLKQPGGREKTYQIEWARPQKRGLVIAFKGVMTRDQAEAIRGGELFVSKASLPELEEDTYYWSDLIGLSVFTKEGRHIGRIHSVIPTGSNDVYVVRDGNEELLIPALEGVILDVNLEDKTLCVEWENG